VRDGADWRPSGSFSSALRCSSPGIRLWTHYDICDNLLVHVTGRKRVVLFPPTDVPCLYVDTSSSAVVDIDAPDFERYPAFRYTHPMECILEPGDILFIPALWFHNVESLEFAISVNFFWHNLSEDQYDANDLYGNKDLLLAQDAVHHARYAAHALSSLPPSYQPFYQLRCLEAVEASGTSQSLSADSGHP
jgi:tRNA wybutosine-synthesizing protein 5